MAAAPATSSTGSVAGFLAQWAAAVSGRVGTALVAGAAVLQEVQAASMVGPERWGPRPLVMIPNFLSVMVLVARTFVWC